MGIRFTISRPTQFSPYQVLFGEDPALPHSLGYEGNQTLAFPDEK